MAKRRSNRLGGIVVLVGVIALLAITNPSFNAFKEAFGEKYVAEGEIKQGLLDALTPKDNNEELVEGLLNLLGNAFANKVFEMQLCRVNLGVASIYLVKMHTKGENEEITTYLAGYGILGTVYLGDEEEERREFDAWGLPRQCERLKY